MKIGIIGFGRFGQFLAQILKRNHKVKVYDKRRLYKRAKKIGVPFVDLNEISKQELIILSVPISQLENVLLELKEIIKDKKTIVMDTCSVKEYPASLLKKHLSKKAQIIACHPMFGPDSGKYGLSGLQIVFWPLKIKEKDYKKVKKIFSSLSLEILEISPKSHDRQTAISLCLVHFIGRILQEMKIKAPKIQTLGFKYLTKMKEMVENDSFQLFLDMQKYNKYASFLRKKFLNSGKKIEKLISTLKKEKGGEKNAD